MPLALGKSIGGEPIVVDLARMPHLLIAGTTGSGKSVGINTMILSLLYRLPPSQCNFIMIDPKMLELSVYDRIPHLLAPVVTDPKKAVAALKWTVKEMNTRYELMSKLGVRNITSYNQKVATAQLRGQKLRRMVQTGFDPHTEEPIEEEETFEPVSMTYIVVVIDEMADLMMVAGKDIEYAVQRLSQMARAAGIHLIMATQRPSVDVVTGTIKANFPSRISFQVTSKIDSRTIIGEQGAEQLLGQGDMLYMASGGRIIRAHGPFVSDDEVEAVARHLKAQGFPSYREDILEDSDSLDDNPSPRGEGGGSDLYRQAVDIVLKDRKPTTSYLQRRLGIGYNRAASLIERMEQEGIIGAPGRTGRREILLDAGNKRCRMREYPGGHEIAQNLTLSSKLIAANRKHSHRGDRTMDQGRKAPSFSSTGARFVRRFIGLLIIATLPQVALAQGGETAVAKTTPSNPPPVASAPAPVPPAPVLPRPSPAPCGSRKGSQSGGRKWGRRVAGARLRSRRQPQPQAPGPVRPVQESDQEIIGKVNDYFNKLTNLEGTFIQTDPDNTQKQGRFYFARPGRLRFDYSLPSRLKIISDGYYLAIEDYALNTSDKYPLEMTPFRLLLSETVDLAKEANILGIEQGPDTVVITVEDKKGDAAGRISLFFNKADMSLKQWIITDAQGLNTRIEVNDLEQNKRVSAELFEFSKDIGFHRE